MRLLMVAHQRRGLATLPSEPVLQISASLPLRHDEIRIGRRKVHGEVRDVSGTYRGAAFAVMIEPARVDLMDDVLAGDGAKVLATRCTVLGPHFDPNKPERNSWFGA